MVAVAAVAAAVMSIRFNFTFSAIDDSPSFSFSSFLTPNS